MCSLKVPERFAKCLRVSSSVKGKSVFTSPSGREWAKCQTANVGGDCMNPGIRILPLSSDNGLLEGRMGNLLSLRWESILQGGLTTSWPTARRYEQEAEYYHVTLFPERASNFTSRKRRTREHHSDGTRQKHSLLQVLTCLQSTYLLINQWHIGRTIFFF
jgi:hypothetical protein